MLGGPESFSKGDEGFQKRGFRTYQPEQGASNDFDLPKGRGKYQKGKGKERVHPQSGLSASEKHVKKDIVMPWDQTIGIPAQLTIPQLHLLDGLVRELVLHGRHQPF